MKLYVDDLRRCPEGWTIARTITEAIRKLHYGHVQEISLDHDICFLRGTDIRMHKETFMPVALYMAVMPKKLRPDRVRIHTANVDAGWLMHEILRKAGYIHFEIIQLGDDVLQEDIKHLKETL